MMFIFLRIVLSFIIYTYLISQAYTIQCLECQELPRANDCRITTTCSGNSICYLQQVVTSGGLILYSSGCASAAICANKRSTATSNDVIKRQSHISNTDVVTCMTCCDDDFCNIEGCGQLASKPPQRPPICFTCDYQLDPKSCRDTSLCDQDHMCAIQKNGQEWKSECVPALQCRTLEQLSMDNAAGPCYKCCHDDFCNNECTNQVIASSSSLAPVSDTTEYSTNVAISTLNPTRTVLTSTKQSSTTTVTNINTNGTTLQLTMSSPNSSDIPITTVLTKISTSSTQSSSFSTDKIPQTSSTQLPSTHNMISTTKSIVSTTYSEAPASATSPWRQSSATSPIFSTATGTLSSSSPQVSGVTPSFASSTQFPNASTEKITSFYANISYSTSLHPMKTTDSNLHATMKPQSTLQTTSVLPQECNKKLDICFIVDSSGSLGVDGFEKELNFVKNMIQAISYNTTADAEFCVTTFSTSGHTYIKLGHYNTLEELINDTGSIPYITGETNIHLGFHQASTQFHRYARVDAKNVTILLTDGHSTNPDKTLHHVHVFLRNAESYTVGFGNQTSTSELAQLSSGKDYVFEVWDINHLDGIQSNLLHSLCSNSGGQA